MQKKSPMGTSIDGAGSSSHHTRRMLNRQFFGWVPQERIERLPLFGRIDVSSPTRFYMYTLVVLALVYVGLRGVRHSRTGRAIVALNDAPCSGNTNGVNVGGDLQLSIQGGGIFSNGCLAGDGSKYEAMVQDGGVAYVGQISGMMNFEDEDGDPIVVQDVDTKLLPESLPIIQPDCNLPAVTLDHIDRSMTLEAGLYCITGEDSSYAIKLAAKEFLAGDGVTIFIMKGGVDISGGAVLDLRAPGDDPVNNAISGVLFYILSEGKEINIEGTSASSIVGLIYAPYSTVTLTGTADADTPINFSTQVIGFNVNLRGNVNMNVIYDPDENWNLPTSLELAK